MDFVRKREKHRHEGTPQIFKMTFNQIKLIRRYFINAHYQARYAFNQGLAGLVIYRIDSDDIRPECSNVRYPLLKAINSEFKANSNNKQGDQNASNI